MVKTIPDRLLTEYDGVTGALWVLQRGEMTFRLDSWGQ